MPAIRSILWRWEDRPGHEAARLTREGEGWRLEGTAVLVHDGLPCRLDYRIACDSGWRTRSATVRGWVGDQEVEVAIEADAAGRWTLNGEACPQVEGCIDVDLNFSPSTNLLPIRRLGLEIGEEAEVRAAWLRFPSFVLEPLPQLYRLTAEHAYRYESAGGAFVRDLEVDDAGFVTDYPGIWRAVAAL